MKERLTRNIGLKILSIVLAALLWLVITNIDDPITARPFNNVPVQILNADEITKLGEVYDIKEGETINFTASARRKIADELSVSDFKVTADFSRLSDMNAVKIDITCPKYDDDVTITNGSFQVMKINREELVSKPFKVNVLQKGEPAEGYYVYQKTATTLLRVSGPKSKIEKIAQVVVEVNVTDVPGTFNSREKPKALDADGNAIDASNLQFSESAVYVNIEMYRTKTINLNVVTSGTPAPGYMMSKLEYEPKTLEVAAADDILDSIGDLTVTESVTGASQTIEKEVNLQDQLPDGVIMVGDNQTAVINISIDEAKTQDITLSTKDIDVKNKPLGLNLTYLNLAPIIIKVKAPSQLLEMEKLTKGSIKPYIDLTNYTAGTYAVKIGVELPEFMVLENEPLVNIQLLK